MKNRTGISPQAAHKAIRFGRYLLTRKIAQGGMAELYLGCEVEGEPGAPPLVVKCILPELAADPQFLAMFINEAQLAAQMRHPNIVRVFDFGEVDGRLFMVMEYVEGLDCWRFARRMHQWGDDHPAVAVGIIVQVLHALDYAHEMTDVNGRPLCVVHRDLSPSNIYVSQQGAVKLGDFGIARIESDRYRQVTMIPKGKFGYVAPEQVEGRAIDRRADIFAVGIVLAELLIGKRIFSGPSQLSVMMEIKEGRLDTIEQNVDRVEPGLLDILYRALARNPADRYASAREFAGVLGAYMDGQGRTASAQVLSDLVRRAVELSDARLSAWPFAATPGAGGITPSEQPTDRSSYMEAAQRRSAAGRGPDGGGPESPGGDQWDRTPITQEDFEFEKEWLYTVREPDGPPVGPFPFAHVIELICSDRIGADSLVSVNGGKYVKASTRPELARHLPAFTPTWETGEIKIPDRRGSLELESPSQVILSLALRGESGMLVCNRKAMRKEVYFRSGGPLYVASNDPEELLGEYLVKNRAISRQDLEMALSLLPKFNGHLGDTTVALGMLSAVELHGFIGNQIRSRFEELLGWRAGNYQFYRNVPCRADVLEVPLDPFAAVAGQLVAASEKLEIYKTLEAMKGATVSLSSSAGELRGRLALPPGIGQILGQVAAPCPLDELARRHRSPEALRNLVRALYVAVETGVWLLEGSPLPWRETG